MPSVAAGRDVEISSFDGELRDALDPYGVTVDEIPERVRAAIRVCKSFTLVEGQEPEGCYKGRIDAKDLISKIVRHAQVTLCLERDMIESRG